MAVAFSVEITVGTRAANGATNEPTVAPASGSGKAVQNKGTLPRSKGKAGFFSRKAAK